jgi:hypothetical protein
MPQWKVYTSEGKYEAATKAPETAAAVVAFLGDGATIRYGHSTRFIVWREGDAGDGFAGESYDTVAETVMTRLDDMISRQGA